MSEPFSREPKEKYLTNKRQNNVCEKQENETGPDGTLIQVTEAE